VYMSYSLPDMIHSTKAQAELEKSLTNKCHIKGTGNAYWLWPQLEI